MENTTLAAPQGGAAESRTAEMLDAESEIYLGELAAFQSDARKLCTEAECPIPPPEELAGFFRAHLASAIEAAIDALLPRFLEERHIPLVSATARAEADWEKEYPLLANPAGDAKPNPFIHDTIFDESLL